MGGVIPSSLSELADIINWAHKETNESFKYTLSYAIHAGECLTKAKTICGHGKYLSWLKSNTNVPERTARMYMELAENKNLLSNRQHVADLTIRGALKLLKGGTSALQSMSNEWWTPPIYISAVHEVLERIDLDPASCSEANKTIGAQEFYTEQDDGLSQPWHGKIFMNPPYGKLGPHFMEKFYEEFDSTVEEAIILLNANATETDWFQPCFEGVLCFTDHRIDFDSPNEKKSHSTHGNVFVYFGPHEKKFAEVFSRFGNIVKRWP